MALTDPSPRRTRPVRLKDISLAERCKAARALTRQGEDPADMLAAALSPTDTTYYVADSRLAA